MSDDGEAHWAGRFRGAARVYVCPGYESLRAADRLTEILPSNVPSFILWFGGNITARKVGRSDITVVEFPLDQPGGYAGFLRRFRTLLADHPVLAQGNVDAFIPHPLHFAANYFAYGGRAASLSLLPDGMINYSARRLSRTERIKSIGKWALGLRFGVPYRMMPHGGHITEFDRIPYAFTFTFDASRLVSRRGEVIEISESRDFRKAAGDRKRILILDQELSEILGPEDDAALREAALHYVKSQNPELVYYKAHPKGRNRLGDVQKILPGALAVEQPGPVEDVALGLDIGEFVSYYSTALISLQRVTSARMTSVLPATASGASAAMIEDVATTFADRGIHVLRV